MTPDKAKKLIEKIDHKNKEKITWTEFLLFSNNFFLIIYFYHFVY